jgi:hypothetical protein
MPAAAATGFLQALPDLSNPSRSRARFDSFFCGRRVLKSFSPLHYLQHYKVGLIVRFVSCYPSSDWTPCKLTSLSKLVGSVTSLTFGVVVPRRMSQPL